MIILVDYFVSAVRYANNTKSWISQLKVHINNGNQVGPEKICTKESVIESIEENKSYCTIIKDSEGKWTKGEKIIVFRKIYLKTVQNDIEEDNLGSLPEF